VEEPIPLERVKRYNERNPKCFRVGFTKQPKRIGRGDSIHYTARYAEWAFSAKHGNT
jgi:hypothetical protein